MPLIQEGRTSEELKNNLKEKFILYLSEIITTLELIYNIFISVGKK